MAKCSKCEKLANLFTDPAGKISSLCSECFEKENKEKTTETTNWEYQQEQAKKESEAEKNKEWFSPKRWLTDKEIDWATDRLAKNEQFKILPAHQFHYVKETKGTAEANAHLAFLELLSELTGFSGEISNHLWLPHSQMNNLHDYSIVGDQLVFIPVNNPDFHWSLLVYETKTKCFYHFDTLKGANWEYAKSLCEELLKFLLEDWQSPNHHLKTRHDIRQGNGWDCGIAVIAIIKRIRDKYQGNLEGIKLGEFDFKKERKELRTKYLAENGTK